MDPRPSLTPHPLFFSPDLLYDRRGFIGSQKTSEFGKNAAEFSRFTSESQGNNLKETMGMAEAMGSPRAHTVMSKPSLGSDRVLFGILYKL